MLKEIKWSGLAKNEYHTIIDYLIVTWGEKSAELFIADVDFCLYQIQRMPLMFPVYVLRNDIRYSVINKYTKLYYLIRESDIVLITFFNTKQNPNKLKI